MNRSALSVFLCLLLTLSTVASGWVGTSFATLNAMGSVVDPDWQLTPVGVVTGTASESYSSLGGECDLADADVVYGEPHGASSADCAGTNAPAGGWCRKFGVWHKSPSPRTLVCGLLTGAELALPITDNGIDYYETWSLPVTNP